MGTNKNSSNNYHFIFSIGIICFFNILSTELTQSDKMNFCESDQVEIISDSRLTIYY
jgi:hypothetical protein